MEKQLPEITLDEAIETACEMLEDATFRRSKSRSPRSKRMAEHSIAFWTKVRNGLKELKEIKETQIAQKRNL